MIVIWTIFLQLAWAAPSSNVSSIVLTNGEISITGLIHMNGSAHFLGIPYATASRWEDPIIKPLESAVATMEPNGCPQICDSIINCPRHISEDCLFLNVWTPFNRSENFTDLRPVLVYIHGGSFQTGHGYLEEFAELSMALDCVIVSFNYRLSIFGFFYTNSKFENFGIKDQRLALVWINENIGLFGGDKEKITVLGQSAGGLSTLIHRAHPQTRSIIRNMILMSLPAVPFASEKESINIRNSLGSSICPGKNDTLQLECLKSQQMMSLLVNHHQRQEEDDHAINRNLPPNVDGLDVIEHPFSIFRNASYMNGSNIIVGSTSNETYLFLNRRYHGSLSTPMFEVALLSIFGSERSSIKNMYPDTEGFTGDQKDRLIRISTDSIFTCPIRNYLTNSSQVTNIYSYYWEVPFPGSIQNSFGKFCNDMACHGTDLAYLLDLPFQDDQKSISYSFRKHIADFLLFGSPGTDNNTWAKNGLMRFTTHNSSYWDANSLQDNCDFWDSRNDLYLHLYAKDDLSHSSYVEIFCLLFFAIFVILQLVLLVYSWTEKRDILDIQGALTEFDIKSAKSTLNVPSSSLDGSENTFEDSFHSIFNHPLLLELSCENLCVEYSKSIILGNISVSFVPGSLTAIMGPSGCGKTTLLTALRGRLESCRSGDLFIGYRNIRDIPLVEVNSLIGFVSQHNPPFWGLTCRELLNYYSRLLSPEMTNASISQKTLDVLNLMELLDCCDVVISEPGTKEGGLSGGQLRKVAIAVVLLQIPSIILLDEPTSGLDSENAFEVIQILSKLAAHGHTVLCTIHQPRIEVYNLFTDVLVLTKMGVLYHGSPSNANTYLEKNYISNGVLDPSLNPADSLLKLATNYSDFISAGSLDINKSSHVNATMINGATETTLVEDIEPLSENDKLPTIIEVETEYSGLKSTMINNTSIIKLYVHEDSSSSGLKENSSMSSREDDFLEPEDDSQEAKSTFCSTNSSNSSLNLDTLLKSNNHNKRLAKWNQIFSEIRTLNARWWSIRPFSRKVMMLLICLFTSIIVGFIHRRPGQDLVSFELQMKGLLLGFIGLPAIKNIAISYDFYRNRELHEFDFRNGISGHFGFFCHRLIYETAITSLEAIITIGIGAVIMDCNLSRLLHMMSLFLAYFNTVSSFFTCLFSTRLGSPEARSISFLIQALFAITSGLWLRRGDSAFYSIIEWIKYLNPQYWAVSSLLYLNVHSSGECLINDGGHYCLVNAGDAFESHVRLLDIPYSTSIVALLAIWTGIRLIQYIILRSN